MSPTRESIAAAAIELADEVGFEHVSMRKVAARLGTGTMTLYHYVATKDELKALMSDAIMGEIALAEGVVDPADWRASLRAVAISTRDAFKRHPWLIASMWEAGGGPPGPNAMLHFEQSVAAVSGLPLPQTERLEIIATVDDYVFGHSWSQQADEAEMNDPAFLDRVAEYMEAHFDEERMPHTSALRLDGEQPRDTVRRLFVAATAEGRFERGLDRLLDGIQAAVDRAQAG